jgi:hypothetical protein
MVFNKLLIIGHARHGKDTVAEFIKELFGLRFESSSVAASRIFLFDALKSKYGYLTPEECFEDRVNHRQEWYELICEFNKYDKAKLAKDILQYGDIYVGMRDNEEIDECLKQGVFDLVIGVFDPRKPLEPSTSFNIDLFKTSDIIIPNASNLHNLKRRVRNLEPLLFKRSWLKSAA